MMLAAQFCFGLAAMCAAAAVVGLLVLLVGLWRERRRRIAEEKRFAMDPVRRFRP